MFNSRVGVRAFFGAAMVFVIGIFAIGPTPLMAQGTAAAIAGTVTDPSGAAVPEAAVQVTNVGTGIEQSATTDAQGRYSVLNLEIGAYEVQVSKEGFSTLVKKGITLTVGNQTVVDFALSVGTQAQSVTVEAQVVQVETTTSTLSALMDQKQVSDLPLNGRDFEQLIQLTPGVTAYAQTAANARQGANAEAAYGGPGARTQGQALLFDDEDIQNVYRRGIGTVTGTSLGVEATAEFAVLTNTYSAQFAGTGIVINSASKSGTNSLHGSLYEYLRNSALDARNFFDPAVIPPFRRNQYGASLGGPIKKNKLFFFANYEGIQQQLGQSQIATVPLVASDCTPACPVWRTPTNANPAVNAAVAGALALFPAPTMNFNTTTGTGQLTEVANQNASESYGLARIDYTISSADSIFMRYFVDRQYIVNPYGVSVTSSQIPDWPEQDNGHSDFFTTEWKRIVSNSMINTARFSFSRVGVVSVEPSDAPATPAIQFFPASSGRTVGRVSVTGLSSLGLTTFTPAAQAQNRFTGAEDLLWSRGAHTLRFGASVVRMDTNVYYPFTNGGSWAFLSLTNFLAGNARTLTGVPLGPQFSPYRQYREIDFAFYVQDDWKVSPKLTLNLGVRYEPQTNPIDAHGAFHVLLQPVVAQTGFTQVDHVTQKNPNWTNIDPRIGFAYDVFGDHKTAVRGGFAINHAPINAGDYTSAMSTAPPWNQFQQTAPPIYPIVTGLATSVPSAAPGWNYYNNKDPYYIMYNLNVQREVARGTVLSVGYVGSRGVHLETGLEANPPTVQVDANGVLHFAHLSAPVGTPGATLISNPRINPLLGAFGDSTGIATSRYNALQVNVNRRFNGYLSVQGTYTYSECVDDGNNYLGLNYNSASGNFENPYNPAIDRGRCTFDIPNNFHVNGIIALPLHKNRLVEGWQLSPILTITSGLPFSVTDGFDYACNLTCTPRPNVVAGCNPEASSTVGQWFNPNCFTLQAAGTMGNLGRDTLRGPNLREFDISLLKDTRITESYRLQFRVDAFNLLNRANFGGPAIGLFTAGTGANVGGGNRNPTAGQITTTSTTSRQLQISLKFLF